LVLPGVPATPGQLNRALAGLRLQHATDGSPLDLPVSGAFLAVGHVPQSGLVTGQLEVDGEGLVLVDGRSTRTGAPGVFAAGDLVDHTYRQAITAAGSGCQAALDAQNHLRDLEKHPQLMRSARSNVLTYLTLCALCF
jgi:thioredoxin reductase (NADPH)